MSEEGAPYQYLAIRQDITELKLAQRRIMEQQEALVSASKLSATGEMAAAITHEINNPLGVILGRCEMLKSMVEQGITDSQQLIKVVEHIEVTGKRIEKIVKSMKSLSHGGDDEPMYASSAQDILSDSLELCLQRFRNHGINLKVNKLNEDFTVECRSHQIAQVIVNLLNNSFDAVQELDEKWVEISALKENDRLKIIVTDSGTGIPLESQKKLFEPFFSTKRVQYGTGLGLSISKNICRKHQGDLVYNSLSKNTQFLVLIPVKQKRESEASL
jgi:C4-dicarboxylate-specific signal transduction histidine kinase